MTANTPLTLAEIKAATDWWRDAGVDCDFADDVTDWLAEPAAAASGKAEQKPGESASQANASQSPLQKTPEPESAPAPVNLLGDTPPATLAEFREFWMTAPGLDAIGPRGRVPPLGMANAAVMVLVVDPEEQDRERILSGPQGQLLERMMVAMQYPLQEVYIASALTRHTPMADTTAAAQAGMQGVLAHHIQLVKPKRILAFGKNILPLLGHDPAQDLANLQSVKHNAGNVSALVSEGLDSLMTMPRLKARLWRRWLEWSADQ